MHFGKQVGVKKYVPVIGKDRVTSVDIECVMEI